MPSRAVPAPVTLTMLRQRGPVARGLQEGHPRCLSAVRGHLAHPRRPRPLSAPAVAGEALGLRIRAGANGYPRSHIPPASPRSRREE